IRTVLSALPEASRRPSPLKANEYISPRCPLNACNSLPVAVSQTRTVSLSVDASSLPSVEKQLFKKAFRVLARITPTCYDCAGLRVAEYDPILHRFVVGPR